MPQPSHNHATLGAGDALIIVDVQNDFLPGGSLAVPQGDRVIAPLNDYITCFQARRLPVFATRDWHPPDHSSFKTQGGPWPIHCVAGTPGAAFTPQLQLPADAIIISKGMPVATDGYSGFAATDLDERLAAKNIHRVFIGGLATDYCVLNTVRDAVDRGYQVFLLHDAVQAVNIQPDDGKKAEEEMAACGAVFITRNQVT